MKTTQNSNSVEDFLTSVDHEKRVADARKVMEMMHEVTGVSANMWGPSIVGYGKYTYTYDSGRSGEWFITGLSPRKANLSVYFMIGFKPLQKELEKLGKHKLGKSCLYINKLEDIDLEVLRTMIEINWKKMSEQNA